MTIPPQPQNQNTTTNQKSLAECEIHAKIIGDALKEILPQIISRTT